MFHYFFSGGDSSGGSADERAYDPKGRTFPQTVNTLNLRDRVWSLAADPGGRRVVVGTAGLAGVPSLHVIDLETLRGVAGLATRTQFYSVDFSQSRIDVKKCVFNKCTITVWDLRA